MMKTSAILCACIAALATAVPAGEAAFAAQKRAYVYKSIDPKDKDAVAACKKNGGKVGKDLGNHDACVIPLPPDNG
jgi:ABC-type sugar transport system substrate-binding protein